MAHHDLCDTVMYARDTCTCEEEADDNAAYHDELCGESDCICCDTCTCDEG